MASVLFTRNDTKVKLRRLKEYDGRWLDTDETLFLQGKPSKDKITDIICGMTSHSGLVIIDSEFDVLDVTLADFTKRFTTNGKYIPNAGDIRGGVSATSAQRTP